MAPLPVGQGSKEPARGGVLGVSSATSFFLEFPLLPHGDLENFLLVFKNGQSTRKREANPMHRAASLSALMQQQTDVENFNGPTFLWRQLLRSRGHLRVAF